MSTAAAATDSIQHISSLSEFQKLIRSKKPIIVDYYADWCGPCRMIAPKFAELARTYPHVVFVKVNVDGAQEIASAMGVKSMPTFHLYKNGEKVAEIVGADPTKLTNEVKNLAA